jgi:hypothetical protein
VAWLQGQVNESLTFDPRMRGESKVKQIKIQIFSDGRVQAEVGGIKGKACMNYIRVLEEILEAEAIESAYTSEYYETNDLIIEDFEYQEIKSRQP